MKARQRLRLRQEVASPVVLEWFEPALIDELADGDRIGPDVDIWIGGEWIDLRDHPDKPWCDRMAEYAVAAVPRCDPATAEEFARKVLRYNRDGADADGYEAVRWAKLILG